MNLKAVIVSLLLISSFCVQSQSKEDTSKNNPQSDEQEKSYINVVGPQPFSKQPESPEEAPEPEPEIEEMSQDERLALIHALEEEHGPHHQSLIRELIILGVKYAEQGSNSKARDAYLRSLEIHRVNFGLHSPGKFAMVEQLIIINRAMGEWGEVNKYYEYLYWLYRRHYGEDSIELVPMLSALVAWKTEAINKQLYGNGETLFKEAQRASRRARDINKQYDDNRQLELELEAQALTPQ
ncbi:hypothetical protein EYS14_22395 [Alteromonadaceae bacterium M269]|nr:hypothetical protein EYS14_22395 [Alteromonadaceae bacterium M269]